jgi:hypothetical protein
MSLSPDDVKVLVQAFEASDWDEMSVRFGDTALELTRTGRPPTSHATPEAPAAVAITPAAAAPAAPAAAPAAAAPAASATGPASNIPDGHVITAPSLGLFWRSPQPGAPPFVEVGQQVNAEDTVCIVEVMKLMNHVKAGATGTVAAIVPGNGEMVEFGVPLVVITPDA